MADHGFAIEPSEQAERLTNIRFADDLLLFAKSLDEATYMLDELTRTLRGFGLELNVKKAKLLSTSTVDGTEVVMMETAEGFVELISSGQAGAMQQKLCDSRPAQAIQCNHCTVSLVRLRVVEPHRRARAQASQDAATDAASGFPSGPAA